MGRRVGAATGGWRAESLGYVARRLGYTMLAWTVLRFVRCRRLVGGRIGDAFAFACCRAAAS